MSRIILSCEGLSKVFVKDGKAITAVNEVSFSLREGEILGIIGESGSGKTTLAQLLTGLLTPTAGNLFLDGKNMTGASSTEWRQAYKNIQMVFQDAAFSFNPRRKIGASIQDILHFLGSSKHYGVEELLSLVGLPVDVASRYPFELSGGECQRAVIARAMAVSPRVLICDEATSALDVSVQAKIVTLLKELQEREGLSLLFISHDLPLVSSFATKLLLLEQGKVVAEGEVSRIIENPQSATMQRLLDAVL